MSSEGKIRIVKAVKQRFPNFSLKQIRDLITNNNIRINNRTAKPNQFVSEGANITIDQEILNQKLAPNPTVKCQLIKKTKDYILFYKPSLLHSVAQDPSETLSCANWLLTIDPKLSAISPLECGLLQRLDFETSGIMVAARTPDFYKSFKEQLRNKKVYKEYIALVDNSPLSTGLYTGYAGKNKKTNKKIIIKDKASDFKNRKQIYQKIETEILSIQKIHNHFKLHIAIKTGYRHQIRAHLKHLGSPILGDSLYGQGNHKRLALQAVKLGFFDLQQKWHQFNSSHDF